MISHDVVHKYDVGGVELNIQNEKQARETFSQIIENVHKNKPGAKVEGVQVSQQIKKGTEVILGIKKDPAFGAMVMFGIGGIFVEIFKDISFRIAPVDKSMALEMIHEIKASKLLTGARGALPADLNALTDAIEKISVLGANCPQIEELDINPLIVLEEGKGCFVADTKIVLK